MEVTVRPVETSINAVDGNEHVEYNCGKGRAIHAAPVHGVKISEVPGSCKVERR